MLQVPRQRVPASAFVVTVERHSAQTSAYRAGLEPEISLPSLRKLALAVTRRGTLDMYRETGRVT